MAPQDVVPETFPQSLEGPALKIRDHLLKWEGAPKPHVQTSQTRSEPVEFRLMFESGVEEEVTSCLPMENCGTTAIYYSWKVYKPVVDVGFWKGGFRCPERFRLRSRRMCAQNDKTGSAGPKEPPWIRVYCTCSGNFRENWTTCTEEVNNL